MVDMNNEPGVRPSELREIGRLAVDAVEGVTDLVEDMHHNISRVPGIFGAPARGRTRGITGLVYRSIRAVTGLVGSSLDGLLARIEPLFGAGITWPGREPFLAALNGVLGEALAAAGSPLAIEMRLRRNGSCLELDAQGLAAAIPRPSGKLVLLVHGLAMCDLQWSREGHDHGAALARDLDYTAVYLHYNSGLHVSANGRELALQIETLLRLWPVPVEELVILGYSMGGLVSRSACHYGAVAGHAWLRRLSAMLFLGTPHHGAPLERGGNWVNALMGLSPYTAPLARLGMNRSAGITDLRHGNLIDEDWRGRDRFELSGDPRGAVPLPPGVECYAIAATTAKGPAGAGEQLPGDGLVPLESALGLHADPRMALSLPDPRCWVGHDMNHLDLLGKPEVYRQINQWLSRSPR